MYLWYLEKIWRKSANPDTKKSVGDKFVSARLGRVGQKCRLLAVGPTCRRHVGDFPSQEEGHLAHQLAQIDNLATREILNNYGFIPDPKISTHLSAHHVLDDTPTGFYLSHFTNKKFHDLTTKKSIPAAAATVLGFGLKFIPVPKKSIKQDDVDEAIKRFDRDFYLKVFFADSDDDDDDEDPIKKLRVNSVWKPDQPPTKLLNASENSNMQSIETSVLNVENLILPSSKQTFSRISAAIKILSLPTPAVLSQSLIDLRAVMSLALPARRCYQSVRVPILYIRIDVIRLSKTQS